MLTLKQFENTSDNSLYFLTLKTINGLPVILNKKYYNILTDSLKYCMDNKGWIIYAYIILINHIHLIVKIEDGYSLSGSISDFKGFTSKSIIDFLREDDEFDILNELFIEANKNKDRNCKIWRRSVWPETISSREFLIQKMNYVDLNPQKHGVVKDIEKYPYTSYHNHYCNHELVLNINDIKELL